MDSPALARYSYLVSYVCVMVVFIALPGESVNADAQLL